MYLAVVARTLSALALCFGSYCWERPPSFQPGALAKQRQECRRTGTIVLSLFFQSCPHLVRSHNNAVSYPFYFCLYSSGRLVLPRGFLFSFAPAPEPFCSSCWRPFFDCPSYGDRFLCTPFFYHCTVVHAT